MTDANLMDADCLHGVVWYECKQCEEEDRAEGFGLPNGADLPTLKAVIEPDEWDVP